jgi:polygalacturonase
MTRLKQWTIVTGLAAWLPVAGVSTAEFRVNDFGARTDGEAASTAAIQSAIDAAAAAGGGVVRFGDGTYRSGAVFLKSNVRLHLDAGVTLCAIPDDTLYPERPTRVAGIEMVWPSALINVYQQTNVTISGRGVIDGNGQYWWHKFWGADSRSGMLGDYRARGLRWAVDYDCKRVRAVAVYDSRDVHLRDVTIKRSGFWSLTLTYSEDVTVDGVIIRANVGGYGPSSDGIDIDSSRHILVQNCDIDCNDDNICLKAGRDADGLRVNRPTEHVTIRNCVTRSGHGMLTLGSETSGGIRHVLVDNLKALGTANGVRIKSARVRGGVVEDIRIQNLVMQGVDHPLHFELNWYPAYSYPTLPKGLDPDTVPAHWKVLTQMVEPPERGIPEVRNLVISNLTASGAETALYANAYPEKPMRDVHLDQVRILAREAGRIRNAADWTFEDVTLKVVAAGELQRENCRNVPVPELVRIEEKDLRPFVKEESTGAGQQPVRLGLGNGALED